MHRAKMWRLYITGIMLYLANLTSGDEPKIVIVGAGAAGIAAASKLFENGFQNVTILEAEDRIGGRVYTTRFDESWIDLGAQNVHGETNNTAFQLAWPLGLLEIPQGKDGVEFIIYNSEGYQLPTSIGNNLVELFFNIWDVYEDESIPTNGSVADRFITILDIEFAKYPIVNETLRRQFLKLFDGFSMVSDASDSWNEVSVRDYMEYETCDGSNIVNWKDRGYGTILDILMKKYPNPEEELPVLNNTLLNLEVLNINYNSTEGKAVVETRDGRKFTADHVIVTSSLGVLKENHKTLFTPELPEQKVKTIQGLAMGSVAKIYFSFEAPWWPQNSSNFGFIWNDDDRQEYENDPDRKWLVDIVGFITVAHKPRLLCGWVSGASARYMETLSEDQVFDQSFALLNKFLGKSFNITRPTGMLRTKWFTNKHFRGTYSFRSIESENADVWADDLAAPLLVNEKPILMFAGEATHAHRYSTVHGAIDTGFREANRLINIYN